MPLDRMLDPKTGDYRDAGNGAWEWTSTIASALLHQIRGRLGEWWGDGDAGSDLHKVPKVYDASAFEELEEAVRACIKPFVDAGRARDLRIHQTTDQRGRIVLEATVEDVQSGEALDLTPTLRPYGA